MSDHNLGDQVFKETKIKDKEGKEKRIGDIAQNSWGVPPSADITRNKKTETEQQQQKRQQTSEQTHEQTHQPDIASKDVQQQAKDLGKAVAEGALIGAALAHDPKEIGKATADAAIANANKEKFQDIAKSAGEGAIAAVAESKLGEQSAKERHEQLVEASKRIKHLNNELHKPGGPLANSDLELIGFDKAGRLLMIHRDKGGKVDGKYLVDHESGQIVAKTKEGHLDKWDKSPDYDRKEREHGNRPKDWHSEQSHGATVWKDKDNQIREVNRANGDTISVTRDAQGKASEINVSYAAREGKSGRVEQFKVSPDGDVVVQSQGIKEAWQKMRDSAQKAEILDDGSLQLQVKENERRTLRPDGSSVETKQINGQWVATQVGDAYGDRREYKWDDKATKLTEITIHHSEDKTTETFRPGTSVHGVQQDFWYRYPLDPKEQGKGQKFQVESDGTLRQYSKANEYISAKPDGSVLHTVGNETKVLRPAYKPADVKEDANVMSITENLVPEIDQQSMA